MTADRKSFIKSIQPLMINCCKGTKLFPSVMIAQACLESNNGLSELSVKYRNYFGLKTGKAWQGPVIGMPTKEYQNGHPVMISQNFRVYKDIQECFTDHIKVLQTVPCYTVFGLFKAPTPESQALVLRQAGYATDPAYPQKLIAIINECNLKEIDSL